MLVAVGVVVMIAPIAIAFGLAAFDAVSEATFPTAPKLTVRNDTDFALTITVADSQEGPMAYPPHRTESFSVHLRPDAQFTTVAIDLPTPKLCRWAAVQMRPPLVVTAAGAQCKDTRGTPDDSE